MNKMYCRLYQFVFRCASVFLPWRRPKLLNGLASPAELLCEKGVKSVLVVTDAGLVKIGLHAGLLQVLEGKDIRCAVYDKTLQNPTIDNIEDALALYKKE